MSNDSSLIHPTYRHLDRPIRLGGLTPVQWAQLVASGAAAWLLAKVLPFGSTYDLSVAVTIAGIPAAASLAAGTGSGHPFAQIRAVLTWRRRARLYVPCATTADVAAKGYRLSEEP